MQPTVKPTIQINTEEWRKLGKPIFNIGLSLRLDDYLAKYFLFHSRNIWKKLIRSKKVLVNSKIKKPAYKLSLGDQVTYYSPQELEPQIDRNLFVIWQQESLAGIYKPPNIPMHEGGVYRKNTFCEVLKEKMGDSWAPIHRLDRETSGLVLCGESSHTRKQLSAMMSSHLMQKTYYAIAIGKPSKKQWTVNEPIGAHPNTNFRTKQAVVKNGQEAITIFKVLKEKPNYCLLEVKPKTGRTHQIRVHAAWSELPLVGDKKYCKNEAIYLEYMEKGFTPLVKKHCISERLCLHAKSLEFDNPLNKAPLKIQTALPDDMQEIWDRL